MGMTKGVVVEVTPTITAGAYSSGDQVGGIQTLTGVNLDGGGSPGWLRSVTILDKAQQKKAIDLFFFDESPTITSADGDTVAIADAVMADTCIGHVTIAAADYKDIGSTSSVACTRVSDCLLKPFKDGKVYVVAVVRDTPTYTSTSDLVFRYVFQF